MSASSPAIKPAVEQTRWTIPLATVASIPIRVHITLLLLLVWIAWLEFHQASASGLMPNGGVFDWIVFVGGRVLFIIGLFGCVLVHEIGHALAARSYAIRTEEILLYPFGGIARLKGMGTPMQELWVSLAGPAVNLLLGCVLFIALSVAGVWITFESRSFGRLAILEHLALANLFLAAFNLIPAFPMDGGRVLRAILARRLGMARGTRLAARIGQALAVGIGILGFTQGNFVLVVIALFVFLSATQENAIQNAYAAMEGHTVGGAMIREVETLPGSLSLSQATDRMLGMCGRNFSVTFDDGTSGLLTCEDLMRGLSELGPRADVAAVARRGFLQLAPGDSLRSAVERMQSSGEAAAAVIVESRLAGILTLQRVEEYLRSQSQMRRRA